MTEYIKLPHLPECLITLPLETLHEIQSHTYHAIKADRQLRVEPTPSEAVYAFSAWLTTRDQDVTIGSTQNAAIVAELVNLFVDSQGWDQPRGDYINHIRAYPIESPQTATPKFGEEQ